MNVVKFLDNSCALVGCSNKVPMYAPTAHIDEKRVYAFCSYVCREIAICDTGVELIELKFMVGIDAKLAWFSCLKDKDQNRK